MRVIVVGACGRMGGEVVSLCKSGYGGTVCAARIDHSGTDDCFGSLSEYRGFADVLIDFSSPSGLSSYLEEAVLRSLPTVIAVTGHSESELDMIREASKHIPIFLSCNFSFGIAHILRLSKKLASFYPDAELEILETHHSRKSDAPSGTALMLAEALSEGRRDADIVAGRKGRGRRKKNEIGIQSLRYGKGAGTHEIILCAGNELITLKHEALSPSLFAEGAIRASEFLLKKKNGLYGMNDLSEELYGD